MEDDDAIYSEVNSSENLTENMCYGNIQSNSLQQGCSKRNSIKKQTLLLGVAVVLAAFAVIVAVLSIVVLSVAFVKLKSSYSDLKVRFS